MPVNTIDPQQSQRFSLWNIFNRNAQPPRPSETNFPLLESVASIAPSAEDFRLPELDNGRSIRLAVQNLQNPQLREINNHSSSKQTSSGLGWKAAATLVGAVAAVGGGLFFINQLVNSSSNALLPVDESLTPNVDDSITAWPEWQSSASPMEEPQVAALQDYASPVTWVNEELTLFNNNFYKMKPQEIFNEAGYLNSLILPNVYSHEISAKQTRPIGNKIARLIRSKINPLLRDLRASKLILKKEELNNDTNLLRIQSLNNEINDVQKAKEILQTIIIKLNRVYMDHGTAKGR